ncbi:MAG: helix-turn-helix transcriptional regulator [Clostridia bacterium]|nr:helix-turn-helix transcriptional regulator [Clostridia bacterium]
MEKLNEITTTKDYGIIKIKLKEVLDEKSLTRYQLAKLTNTRFEVINKWYWGEVERIDTDVLARFCFVLNCNVSDLIEYEASSRNVSNPLRGYRAP